ncbi:glycolate oxidase subunit GlcE [Ramlibacter sp. PS4R-6]|uniref:glycolate oxidase subunit GlcE n=1 Tax=Ramlibacter sp. PS4R-6 TaxID=3133438 RepID=UPI0030A48AF2
MSVEAVTQRIRDAAQRGETLRIRGGGTKDFYGEPARGEELSTLGLSGITAYEPSELVVTVRAGTRLAELEAVLAERGQCLAFEPLHFAEGTTVGGMVAAGLAGPARASAGPVRDYVLGVTIVNGRGELLSFGGTVMKNVAGYDVSRLMVGALGTLGLIAEVSLKVLPVAPAEATLRFDMTQAEALRRLNEWGGQPLPLNASWWAAEQGRGTLSLRLRGAVAAVDAACRTLGGERLRSEEAAPQWLACRDQRLPGFAPREGGDLWRISVPQTAPVLELGDTLVEWHGAQRWVQARPGEGARIRDAAQRAGGHATLFRPRDAGATQRFTPLAPPLDRIHRELKREFDPAGVFNRGRLYPDF